MKTKKNRKHTQKEAIMWLPCLRQWSASAEICVVDLDRAPVSVRLLQPRDSGITKPRKQASRHRS